MTVISVENLGKKYIIGKNGAGSDGLPVTSENDIAIRYGLSKQYRIGERRRSPSCWKRRSGLQKGCRKGT
jgi:hypothetical protein